MATNRFLCEICGKGFQRDQNLQLHRRGHNLPWKLKQRTSKEVRKRVYVCPEKTCVHHHPSRALGDLTGIKKHFCRKHGEKKWKCDKCSKRYAVHSDFLINPTSNPTYWDFGNKFSPNGPADQDLITNNNPNPNLANVKEISVPSLFSTQNQISHQISTPNISATALLQKAAQIGATTNDQPSNFLGNFGIKGSDQNISGQDGNKFCGLMYGTSSGTSGLGSDVESSVNDLSALNQLEMYNPSKRRRLGNEEITEGETRDFLGVGMQSICHPSSMNNGWM
ncbi:hypothetical protein DH2020_011431 [Rehmannia glutinosa]|uniref:C2H2-type domain-containing protein n=1 Tax=Rehmannia glutinosa TaxID=99300 RepID=A0ABR0XE02_REHGL